MASDERYSDLQVVPEKHHSEALQPGKIVVDRIPEHFHESSSLESGKFVVAGPLYSSEWRSGGTTPLSCSENSAPPPPKPPRRHGLAPKLFWALVAAVALSVIAGAVVGGVVGSNRSKASSDGNQHSTTGSQGGGESDSSSASSLPSSTPLPTPTTSSSITTIREVDAKSTLYRDCPSSNYTIYPALGSSQYQFRKLCEARFPGNGKTVVNKKVASLNDCVDLCAKYNDQNKAAIAAGTSAVCNEVCWRHNLDSDYPGQCFASTYTNSTAGDFPWDFSGTECDSAAWINQVI